LKKNKPAFPFLQTNTQKASIASVSPRIKRNGASKLQFIEESKIEQMKQRHVGRFKAWREEQIQKQFELKLMLCE